MSKSNFYEELIVYKELILLLSCNAIYSTDDVLLNVATLVSNFIILFTFDIYIDSNGLARLMLNLTNRLRPDESSPIDECLIYCQQADPRDLRNSNFFHIFILESETYAICVKEKVTIHSLNHACMSSFNETIRSLCKVGGNFNF